MNWTCCECENQVDERYFDLDERTCDYCMNPEEIMIDKLELWIGTFMFYLQKIAPYLITAMIFHLIINLWRLYAR